MRRLYRLNASNPRRVCKVVYKQATIYEASSIAKLMLKTFSLVSGKGKGRREDLKRSIRGVDQFCLVGPTSLYNLSWIIKGNLALYQA